MVTRLVSKSNASYELMTPRLRRDLQKSSQQSLPRGVANRPCGKASIEPNALRCQPIEIRRSNESWIDPVGVQTAVSIIVGEIDDKIWRVHREHIICRYEDN